MVTVRPISDWAAVAPSATIKGGSHRLDLALQPGLAGEHLLVVGLLVDAALAAQLELEVLDRIGDVDAAAIDAGLDQRAVEQLAGGADERPSLPVLLVTRLLADEHHRRIGWPFAEHGLGRVGPQRAVAAVQRLLRGIVRDPSGP